MGPCGDWLGCSGLWGLHDPTTAASGAARTANRGAWRLGVGGEEGDAGPGPDRRADVGLDAVEGGGVVLADCGVDAVAVGGLHRPCC